MFQKPSGRRTPPAQAGVRPVRVWSLPFGEDPVASQLDAGSVSRVSLPGRLASREFCHVMHACCAWLRSSALDSCYVFLPSLRGASFNLSSGVTVYLVLMTGR